MGRYRSCGECLHVGCWPKRGAGGRAKQGAALLRTECLKGSGVAAALAVALVAGPAPASTADPATTVGFVFGSAAVIRKACGFSDDPDGLGRLLVNARVSKADILPGGQRRGAFQVGAQEARLHLSAKLAREGREAFCAFALQRYGASGLGVVRG